MERDLESPYVPKVATVPVLGLEGVICSGSCTRGVKKQDEVLIGSDFIDSDFTTLIALLILPYCSLITLCVLSDSSLIALRVLVCPLIAL